ncbi:PIR protein [Plasmodium vivax]|nr:PIR protein [Plasmodium vivax]
MSKPSATTVVSVADLEKAAKELKLSTMYDDFFSDNKKPKNEDLCKVFDTQGKKDENGKKICPKVLLFLEKTAEIKDNIKNGNYCNYLTYWFYDELWDIYKDPSKKTDSISFIKELTGVVDKVKGKLIGHKCTLKTENGVSLEEWKKRKFSYIYLTKYSDILKEISTKPNAKCKMHSEYLNLINILYKKYKKDNCKNFLWWTAGPNYADCSSTSKYIPDNLISLLKECKDSGSARSGSASTGLGFSSWFSSSTGSSSNRRDAPAAVPGSTGGADVDKTGKGASNSLAGTTDSTSSVSHATAAVLPRVTLPGQGAPGMGVLGIPPYTSQVVPSAGPVPTHDSSSTSGTLNDKQDSDFIRNIIMAVVVLGTIFFLFFYNMYSGLGSNSHKRKRKKKNFEHNYYKEYENELARYNSENMSLDSEDDQYYLTYQAEGDSHY